MSAAISFVIQLFGDLLITLNNIPFVLGYTMLQFLASASFLVLMWQLIIYVLGRSSGSVRSGVKHGLRNSNKYMVRSSLASNPKHNHNVINKQNFPGLGRRLS